MTARQPRPSWTLERALVFCRGLSEHMADFGFDVAMTGSVLKRGRSSNDLDVVLYPLDSRRYTTENMHAGLRAFGMNRTHTAEQVRTEWAKKGSRDEKHVEVWYHMGRRVDVFALR